MVRELEVREATADRDVRVHVSLLRAPREIGSAELGARVTTLPPRDPPRQPEVMHEPSRVPRLPARRPPHELADRRAVVPAAARTLRARSANLAGGHRENPDPHAGGAAST